MSDSRNAEPKQTTPKGVEIPVPKPEDFLRDLKKVAPPAKPPKSDTESREHRPRFRPPRAAECTKPADG